MSHDEIKWPEMNDAQRELMERLVNNFKKKMLSAAEDAMATFYCDILPHIESDVFLNFKTHALSAVKGYAREDALRGDSYSGVEIRNQIYRDHKDEIVKLLDGDNLKRIKQLEEDLKRERSYNRGGMF